MSAPTPANEKIKAVARMRVEGVSWTAIAEKFHYANAESARVSVTGEHPGEWRQEYERARELYLDEIETEAVLTQRALLRSGVEQVRQSAGHSLLSHCRQLRAKKIELSGALRHDVNHKTPEEAVAAIKEEYDRRHSTAPESDAPKDPNGDQP